MEKELNGWYCFTWKENGKVVTGDIKYHFENGVETGFKGLFGVTKVCTPRKWDKSFLERLVECTGN